MSIAITALFIQNPLALDSLCHNWIVSKFSLCVLGSFAWRHFYITHTRWRVQTQRRLLGRAVEKEKRTQTELFICFSCRVFRIVYASRWSEMTTNRSSYIRPAFWKVPGYVCDVPMTVSTPTAPTSSRLTQRRRSSNSGIKKRVHFADELYSGVSRATTTPHAGCVACQSSFFFLSGLAPIPSAAAVPEFSSITFYIWRLVNLPSGI